MDRLHEHIQTAMGWTNSHLHQFEIQGELYSSPELLEDGFMDFQGRDSTATWIRDIVPKNGKSSRFLYEYDFGDGWEHEVLFEGCPDINSGKQFPLCLEGERACPPEDVGGVWGYEEFLEAIADPNHERYGELMEWCGPFDSEEFNAIDVTQLMHQEPLAFG